MQPIQPKRRHNGLKKTAQTSVYNSDKGNEKITYEQGKKAINIYQTKEISREESARSNKTSNTLIV